MTRLKKKRKRKTKEKEPPTSSSSSSSGSSSSSSDSDSYSPVAKKRKYNLTNLKDVQNLLREIVFPTIGNQSTILKELSTQIKTTTVMNGEKKNGGSKNQELKIIELSSTKDIKRKMKKRKIEKNKEIETEIVIVIHSILNDYQTKDCSNSMGECDCRCHYWGGSGCQSCFSFQMFDVQPLADYINDNVDDYGSLIAVLKGICESGEIGDLFEIEPETSGEEYHYENSDEYVTGEKIREEVMDIFISLSFSIIEYAKDMTFDNKEELKNLLDNISEDIGEKKFKEVFAEAYQLTIKSVD